MKPDIRTDIDSMDMLINTDINLRHKETALNRLGWCYKLKGNWSKAIEYFFESLELQKNHNAAFWHILVFLYELIKQMIDAVLT